MHSVLKDKVSEVYLKQISKLMNYVQKPTGNSRKLRNFKKEADKTHVEYATEKERLFDRWCMSEKIGTKFNSLNEMILLDEFKNCVHPSIKNHITENKVQTLQKSIRISLKPYDVTPCLPCCIVGLFWGKT